MPNKGVNKKINEVILWLFFFMYISFIIIFNKEIYKGIINENDISNNYWFSISLYILGYLGFALISFKLNYEFIGSIFFIVGSIFLLNATILHGSLEEFKESKINLITNKKLNMFWGSVFSLLGSISFCYSAYANSFLFTQIGFVLFIISRSYFILDNYHKL
jgi:hypothetical protein